MKKNMKIACSKNQLESHVVEILYVGFFFGEW